MTGLRNGEENRLRRLCQRFFSNVPLALWSSTPGGERPALYFPRAAGYRPQNWTYDFRSNRYRFQQIF